MRIFIIACISHWETISLLSNVALPDVGIFHYQVGLYQVITVISIIPTSSENSKYWGAVMFMVLDTSVPKF